MDHNQVTLIELLVSSVKKTCLYLILLGCILNAFLDLLVNLFDAIDGIVSVNN